MSKWQTYYFEYNNCYSVLFNWKTNVKLKQMMHKQCKSCDLRFKFAPTSKIQGNKVFSRVLPSSWCTTNRGRLHGWYFEFDLRYVISWNIKYTNWWKIISDYDTKFVVCSVFFLFWLHCVVFTYSSISMS